MFINPADLWLNGAPPPPQPTVEEIKEFGAFVAFERLVCRWLNEWQPLAPIVNQENRPNIITYADAATIESQVTDALIGVGLSIVVDLETAVKKSAMKQAFSFNPFNFMITVQEAPATNRDVAGGGSGITAKRAADLIAHAFEGMPIGNGCASLQGISFPAVGSDQQNAVLVFSTAYVTTLASILI